MNEYIATPYLIEVKTPLGLVGVKFDETKFDEPAKPTFEYKTKDAEKMFSLFVADHGINPHGVRFNKEYFAPVDIACSLQVNDSYHHSPYIVSWNIAYGYIPTGDEQPITESIALDGWREKISNANALNEVEQEVIGLISRNNIKKAIASGYSFSEPLEDLSLVDFTIQEVASDLSDTNRRFIANMRRLGGNILCSKFAKRYERGKAATIIGESVVSSQDLAAIGQIFRHPGFETLRIIFVKGGNVVHQQGITSRLPANVVMCYQEDLPMIYAKINDIKKNCEADGYYLLHNHPSGDPSLSDNDIQATKDFAGNVSGFMGHVVVNNEHYSFLDVDFKQTLEKADVTPIYDAHEPSVPGDSLGILVASYTDVVNFARKLKNQDAFIHIIGRDKNKRISGIMDFKISSLENSDNLKLLAILRKFAQNTGSASIFLSNVPNDGDIYNKVVNGFLGGAIIDAVFRDYTSLLLMASNGKISLPEYNPLLMGVDRPGRFITESLSQAAGEATGHEEATQAMKDSGNYRKGHCRLCGFDVVIEQPAGSYREGVGPDGKPWKTRMNHHYGALLKTSGADGDHVDVFFNPDIADEEFEKRPWFVIDQINRDGSYDECKIIAGYETKFEAKRAYMSNYEEGWEGLGDITRMEIDEFRSWVTDVKKSKSPAGNFFRKQKNLFFVF